MTSSQPPGPSARTDLSAGAHSRVRALSAGWRTLRGAASAGEAGIDVDKDVSNEVCDGTDEGCNTADCRLALDGPASSCIVEPAPSLSESEAYRVDETACKDGTSACNFAALPLFPARATETVFSEAGPTLEDRGDTAGSIHSASAEFS